MECIIKKQRLEVACTRKEDAWRYTDQVKQMLEKKMMPLLEKKLQQFNFNGQTLYLDRVNIQLGTVDPSNLNTLLQRFEKQMDKELIAQLATLGNQKETTQSKKNLQKSTEDTIIYYLDHGYLPWWSKPQKDKLAIDKFLLEWAHQNSKYHSQLLRNWKKWSPRVVSLCKEATLIRLVSELFQEGYSVVSYLKHLHESIPSRQTSFQTKRIFQVQLWEKALVALHQKTPVQQIAVTMLEIVYVALKPKNLSNFKKRFFNTKTTNLKEWDTLLPIVWENFRIITQQNSKMESVQKPKTVIEEQSFGSKQTEISNSEEIKKQESILANEESKEESNQDFGIGTSVKDMDEETREAFTPQTAENLQEKEHQTSEELDSKDQLAVSKKALETTQKTSEEQSTAILPTTKTPPPRQTIPRNTPQFWQEAWNKRVAALREKVKKSLPETIPVQPREPRKILPINIPSEETQEIYIHNAGMVICASYIPKLFQVLALVKDNEFIDDLSMHKALLLGHYLATGEVEAAEHQLPLVKIICGLPINTPFVTGISLSKEEQARADELLTALIKHWPKIGTISIQGFRNSFLKREGKLSNQGQQWQLHVEQRPFDIILQTLPWNIRMIKTSLMQELLLVEWPY